MMRAKARKSEWNKAMKGGEPTPVDDKIDYPQGSSSLDESSPLPPAPSERGVPRYNAIVDEESSPLPPAPSKRGVPRQNAIVEEESSPLPPERGVPRQNAIVEEEDEEKIFGGRKTKRANRRRASRKNRASRRR